VTEGPAIEQERARLLARMRALHQAALSLAAPVSPEPAAFSALVKEIVRHAMRALEAVDGALVLVEDPAWADLVPDGSPEDGLVTVRYTGEPHRRPWRPEGTTWHTIKTGEFVWVEDVSVPSRFGPYPDLVAAGIGSFGMIPLRAGGRILGRLGFNFTRRGPLDPADREAMELFAAHAAAAVERARFVHEQARRTAAEAAVRARDELLTVAAHDLKNPLAVIKGTADALQRRVASGSPIGADQLEERLVRISEAASRASAQLDELRSVTEEEDDEAQEAAPAEITDLVTLVENALASHEGVAGGRRLEFQTDLAELLGQWDSVRLTRVLDNLLSNAIKYSAAHSRVGVNLRREIGPNGSWAVLEVQDEGVGIPAADLPYVFDRFFRGRNVIDRVSGSGIGLAAVRDAVTQMGGTVNVSSRPGKGTTFTVRLPLVEEQRAA
jgi:signal transduction histidine kinase